VVTDVKTLQTHLNRLGFGPVSIDGILGIKSDSAIKKLQTSLGVKADGFIGAKTREVINNSCAI
jgi:peptidoglycan hydrolase-like protein with peptidoglycan-binding domain